MLLGNNNLSFVFVTHSNFEAQPICRKSLPALSSLIDSVRVQPTFECTDRVGHKATCYLLDLARLSFLLSHHRREFHVLSGSLNKATRSGTRGAWEDGGTDHPNLKKRFCFCKALCTIESLSEHLLCFVYFGTCILPRLLRPALSPILAKA